MSKTSRSWLLVIAVALSACSSQASDPELRTGEPKRGSEIEMEREEPAITDVTLTELSTAGLRGDLEADAEAASRYRALAADIETIIPRDAIPAIDDPRFWSADEADEIYKPDERIMGVDLEGEQRAYSIPFLSGVEIVNDELGGRPISVTW